MKAIKVFFLQKAFNITKNSTNIDILYLTEDIFNTDIFNLRHLHR